jgi:hypothetical protein
MLLRERTWSTGVQMHGDRVSTIKPHFSSSFKVQGAKHTLQPKHDALGHSTYHFAEPLAGIGELEGGARFCCAARSRAEGGAHFAEDHATRHIGAGREGGGQLTHIIVEGGIRGAGLQQAHQPLVLGIHCFFLDVHQSSMSCHEQAWSQVRTRPYHWMTSKRQMAH